ncbi:MAG: hypothetical protein ACKOTZ_08230 [Chloroflexota bacterium]
MIQGHLAVARSERRLRNARRLAASVVSLTVATARSTGSAYAAALAELGIDPGYSAWSAQWGAAVAGALAGTPRETAGAVLALNELWYDAITVLMLHAIATD